MKLARDLTVVLPYYMNPGMLLEHQRIWATYPPEVRAQLHVIVVDDASPRSPASEVFAPVEGVGSQRLYRVVEDVRWNWLTCRNIGMHHATTEWRLLTDIDHVMPVATLQGLLSQKLHPSAVYRLHRVNAPHPWPYTLEDCRPFVNGKGVYTPHPNTWLMTKNVYDAVGGYDERLAGCYGTDSEFRQRVETNAARVVLLENKLPMIRYSRDVLPDASTTVFTRKNDAYNDDDLRRRRTERNLVPNWRPLRLTFKYEEVRGNHTPMLCGVSTIASDLQDKPL